MNSTQTEYMKVRDPSQGCATKFPSEEASKWYNSTETKTKDRSLYTRFSFTLFSMMVSGSILAGYNVTTFYMLIAYGSAGLVRSLFIFSTWIGFIAEITEPGAIIKLFEACYMYRFD